MNAARRGSGRGGFRLVAAAAMLVFAIGFLAWADREGRRGRRVPGNGPGDTIVWSAATQRDVYRLYERLGIRAGVVVHVNRYFNLLPYLPEAEAVPASFPIPVRVDLDASYEAGLDSHNWLFVAGQTGMVRKVVTVLPDRVYQGMREYFSGNPEFTVASDKIFGYSFDLSRTMVTAALLPGIGEPVVVNVDAGFFVGGEDPARLAAVIRERCPDVRLVVLVESRDEPEVTDEMRAALGSFGAAWPEAG